MKKNFSILCIDDDPNILDIVSDSLNNYDVFVDINPLNVLKTLTTIEIDLILVDINMPHISGFDLCKRIKEEPKFTNIPIIYITASSSDSDIYSAFSSGGVDYITKPINTMELQQRVKNHLQLHNYQQQLQKDIEDQIDKRDNLKQALHHHSELLNAVKYYLLNYSNKVLSKNDFDSVIENSLELIDIENQNPIINLGEGFKWIRKESRLLHDDETINLKKSETKLLELFILKKNQNITISEIHQYLWDDISLQYNATSVRNLISSLRKKLPKDLIASMYGEGYIFRLK